MGLGESGQMILTAQKRFVDSLQKRGLIDIDDDFIKKFGLLEF